METVSDLIVVNTKKEIELLKEDLIKFRARTLKRFDNFIYWIVGTGIGSVALFFYSSNYL